MLQVFGDGLHVGVCINISIVCMVIMFSLISKVAFFLCTAEVGMLHQL